MGRGLAAYSGYMGAGGASSLQWVHGGNGAWVHERGGPAAYSGYMGGRGRGCMGRGSSCLQWVHGGKGAWVHGGGGPAAYS